MIEKRDRLSRNNVLHLWPFVIEDLRALGAKKFFGRFCAGAIDHISIRQLQCILLKAALLLGVEIHTELSFEKLIEPNPEESKLFISYTKFLNLLNYIYSCKSTFFRFIFCRWISSIALYDVMSLNIFSLYILCLLLISLQ